MTPSACIWLILLVTRTAFTLHGEVPADILKPLKNAPFRPHYEKKIAPFTRIFLIDSFAYTSNTPVSLLPTLKPLCRQTTQTKTSLLSKPFNKNPSALKTFPGPDMNFDHEPVAWTCHPKITPHRAARTLNTSCYYQQKDFGWTSEKVTLKSLSGPRSQPRSVWRLLN